jgi:lysozyme family protein
VVGDAMATIRAHSTARLSFLRSLRVWRSFGRGWATRVAGVEAESVVMATNAGTTDSTAARERIGAEARGAGARAEHSRARAALLALVALLSRVASVSLALVATMLAAALGLAVWSMVVHQERSRALSAAAQAI